MAGQAPDTYLLGIQNPVAHSQRGKDGVDLAAHEVGKAEAAVLAADQQGTAIVQAGDGLAGNVVVKGHIVAVGIALQALVKELAVQLTAGNLCAHSAEDLAEHAHPCIQLGSAVVAVDHGHGTAAGGGDHVDVPVELAQLLFQNHHGEDGGTGGDVAGAGIDGVGCHHAGAGITLRRCHGDTGLQLAGGIQQLGAINGQTACILTGDQHLGQDIADLPAVAAVSDQCIELIQHGLVVIHDNGIDGEHAGGFAHTHDPLTGQKVMDIACQSGDVIHLRNVILAVQDCLIQLGNAPAQRHIELEQLGQCAGGDRRIGISPGQEGSQLLVFLVQSQIAVHHAGDADGTDLGQFHTVLALHISGQICKALLQATDCIVQMIGPAVIFQPVFPAEGAVRQHMVVFTDQDCLDAGGAQLDAQRGLAGGNCVLNGHGNSSRCRIRIRMRPSGHRTCRWHTRKRSPTLPA